LLFNEYPNLEGKVPWVPILSNIPTNIERLSNLEQTLKMSGGEIYIKRDDKIHQIYGGNKLRKFEFIFGNAVERKKTGMITIGGIGSNHCLACAIICKEMNLKCNLFLFPQPLTWHVQRSLLLYNYFNAKLHFNKSFIGLALKAIIYKIFHPKHYAMLPGGSLFFGLGSPIGTLGLINAIIELKQQINQGVLKEPDCIFVAGGSTGTAAGLIAGCKLMKLKTKVYVVAVSMDWLVNKPTIKKNANKALEYLRKRDGTIPKVLILEEDFELITGYLGSDYGVKTKRGQNAVDRVVELEGKAKDFKLDTTYTGKAMAAMLDFLGKSENKTKEVLFWNTYNSNDLNHFLRNTNFDYKKLPKRFHKFYQKTKFQCWQITECPNDIRLDCPAYLHDEYRFWKVTICKLNEDKSNKAMDILSGVITLEDA
jgi:D-cysteine desulfhydrase